MQGHVWALTSEQHSFGAKHLSEFIFVFCVSCISVLNVNYLWQCMCILCWMKLNYYLQMAWCSFEIYANCNYLGLRQNYWWPQTERYKWYFMNTAAAEKNNDRMNKTQVLLCCNVSLSIWAEPPTLYIYNQQKFSTWKINPSTKHKSENGKWK